MYITKNKIMWTKVEFHITEILNLYLHSLMYQFNPDPDENFFP